MNTTKRILSFAVVGAVLILPLFTTSCLKKGDDDPFISFNSRKSRVTGDWTISNINSNIKRDQEDVVTQTTTTIEGLSWSRVISLVGTDSTRTISGNVIEGRNTISFNKDGSFSYRWEYEYSEDSIPPGSDGENIITITTKIEEEQRGTWNFLNNIDDYKNKERLALVIEDDRLRTYIYHTIQSEDEIPSRNLVDYTAYSRAYANGTYSKVWTLKSLKNKTINVHEDVDDFEVITIGEVGSSYTEVGFIERTLTQE